MDSPNIELTAALDDLKAELPELVATYPISSDFWDAFADRSNLITDSALGAAAVYAQGRMLAMLREAGLMPAEDIAKFG